MTRAHTRRRLINLVTGSQRREKEGGGLTIPSQGTCPVTQDSRCAHTSKVLPRVPHWVTSQRWQLEGAAYSRSRLYGVYQYIVFWPRLHSCRNCLIPEHSCCSTASHGEPRLEAMVLVNPRGNYTDRHLPDICLPRPSHLSSVYSPCLFFDEQPHRFSVVLEEMPQCTTS